MHYPSIDDTIFKSSLGLGNMATSVFFALSGFLLTHAYVIMKNGREIDRRSFLLARFSTLYPLHVAGLVLALIPTVYIFHLKGGISVPTELSGTATRMLGNADLVLAFLTNLLLLNAWNPFYLLFNYPSWSLSALAFFYLLFPILAPKVYRMKAPLFALVLLGIAFLLPGAVADLLHRTDVFTDGLLHRNPIVRLPLFVGGMVLCVVYARGDKTARPAVLAGSWLVVLGTAVAGTLLQMHESKLHMIRNGLYYPASLAVIWLCISVKPTANIRLKYWGERLGAASLPMFLLHGPLFEIFLLFEKFVKALFATPDYSLGSIVATGRNIDQTLDFFMLYVIGLTIMCILVQERLVIPLQAKIRHYSPGRKAATAPETKSNAGTG
jgi:peptidoglycan/LPS O-acetylase OafA/YrhL